MGPGPHVLRPRSSAWVRSARPPPRSSPARQLFTQGATSEESGGNGHRGGGGSERALSSLHMMCSLHFVDKSRIVLGNERSKRVGAPGTAGTGECNSCEGETWRGVASSRPPEHFRQPDSKVEQDPNAEVLHWLECMRLAKCCYDLDPPSQTRPPHH